MFFEIFKKKPLLKDLIPNNFTDIHSHLLWGLDDGAKTETEALSLITQMNSLGIKNSITTPHFISNIWENSNDTIKNKEIELQSKVVSLKLNCNIKAAAEYLIDANFVAKMNKEPLLTLKEDYVLVELSYSNPPINLKECLYQMQLNGYRPIMAHPERYLYYANRISEFKHLKHIGCLFQLNLLSTTGYYGKEVLQLADELLSNNLIDFVGSDIHNQNHLDYFKNKVLIKKIAPLQEAIDRNSFFNFTL
ncbi:tyrosine-protein phosphatase [Flavobacterium orientale]|nr:CpsB/CapC family capsule biosynthesis tyrosine phosphatase [Flavobacterium orientale]